MKRSTVLVTLTAMLGLWTTAVMGAVPQLINFQGMLKDGSGDPVPDGPYQVMFTIYDAPTGGNTLWIDEQDVFTVGGLFAVLLGSSTPIPDSAFNGSDRWLGIAVDPDPEMPRQRLVSVGYSYRVNSVDSALGGTIQTKVSIGPGHTNTGTNAFAAGANNVARGNYSVVGGGGGANGSDSNAALGDCSVVDGGYRNIAGNNFATVGGGYGNRASGLLTTVSGGIYGSASGNHATVGGGNNDTASGNAATVGGGSYNRARGQYSTVSGGGGPSAADSNSALGDWSAISGGRANTVSGNAAAVGGGQSNTASAEWATVGGGENNTASSDRATVGGGGSNTAVASRATVGGGQANVANNAFATVGGGSGNYAYGYGATASGGVANVSGGLESSVGGGLFDTATGDYATVPGGRRNRAAGSTSFAAGYRAKALHSGAFVWGDNTEADLASTGPNQFLIRASGGVGIGTNSPARVLDISSPSSMEIVTRRTASPADERVWRLFNSGTNLSFEAMNDALSSGTSVMSLFRDGTTCNLTGTWSVCSDRRLKKQIEPIRNALETVTQLQPVTFRWKDEKKDAQFGRVRGLIAQDVEKVIPDWVKTDPDGYRRIEPIGVDALLIEAIKEQQKQIEELRAEIAKLKEQPIQAQVAN